MATHLDEDQQTAIRRELRDMEANSLYNTESSYSANSNLYPDNVITFTDRHITYLLAHPALNPEHYLANLRLKTKKRS